MAGTNFRILGPVEVEYDGVVLPLSAGQQRRLLALLLVHANETVTIERLASEFWGEPVPERAVKRLQVVMTRLRKALAQTEIQTLATGYRLDVEAGALDAHAFAAGVAEARVALGGGENARAAGAARAALELWRGPPLADVEFDAFAQAEIRRLNALKLEALELAVESELSAGRHRELVGELEWLVAEHPLHERFHAARMLTLYRCGRQSEALEAFREARSELVTAAGVEPSAELRTLHERILHQDPRLDLPPEPATQQTLVGRERELTWLLERWRTARGSIVAVTGPPGIGKSLLVSELARRVNAPVLRLTPLTRLETAAAPALVLGDGPPALREPIGDRLVVVTSVDPVAGADATLALPPLDLDAVRAIAPDTIDPVALLEASGGLPARVHELAARWRVDALSSRAASERAELRSTESALADDVIALQSTEAATTDRWVVCPVKGLAHFDAADAPYFFGRERLVAEALARLVGAPLLCIVGASGSGKSSLLRAGLLPALAAGVLPGSEGWPQTVFRPGRHPLGELGDGDESLLAVDQFEEVFTACRDEAERERFVAELVQRRAPVIIAIRGDFYERCSAYPEFARLIATNQVLVGPMRRDELRRVIEQPVRKTGLVIEPALVDRLLEDVEAQPGALPLLSTTLLELWQRRDGRTLRLAGYDESGGVRAAVARLAEAAYAALDAPDRVVAYRLFLRLAGEGEGDEVVRRRVPLDELPGRDAHVAMRLADARLLTIDRGTVEVAHEALLREWPRLRDWLEEDEEGRRLLRRLSDAAADWEARGRDPADLWRGARLAAALELEPQQLNALELAFLEHAGATEVGALAAVKRRARRLRSLALAFAVLAVVAVGLGLMAVRQSERADAQRLAAQSRSLATVAMLKLEDDPDLGALLSVEAHRLDPTVEARSAIVSALPALSYSSHLLNLADNPVRDLAYSPDGRLLASVDGRRLALWSDGEPAWTAAARNAAQVAFSPDGTRLATGGDDGEIRLWDATSRRPLSIVASRSGEVTVLTFADAHTLFTGGADGIVSVWSIRENGEMATPPRQFVPNSVSTGVSAMAFAPGNKVFAVGSESGAVVRWDAPFTTPPGPLAPTAGSMAPSMGVVTALAFVANGEILAVGAPDGRLRLEDLQSGRSAIVRPRAGSGAVTDVVAGPLNQVIYSLSDGTVRVINARTPTAPGRWLSGHRGPVSIALHPDGTIASAGADRQLLLRHPGSPQGLAKALPAHLGRGIALAYDPAGDTLASADTRTVLAWSGGLKRVMPMAGVRDVTFDPSTRAIAVATAARTVVLRDSKTGRRLRVLRPTVGELHALAASEHTLAVAGDGAIALMDTRTGREIGLFARKHVTAVASIAFSHDGTLLASGGEDTTVRIWDAIARRPRGLVLEGHTGTVRSVAFSRDGTILASGADDGTIRLWDPRTHDRIGEPLTGHAGAVTSVAFARDGSTLASAGDDGTVRLWDIATRRPLGKPLLGGDEPVAAVAFDPDGSTLASAEAGGVIRLWPSILWSRDRAQLERRVCAMIARSLTRGEWEEFLPGRPYRSTCALR